MTDVGTLKLYMHGPAFERGDLSNVARSALSPREEK